MADDDFDRAMADDDFDREMADADWGEVYERQAARGDLVDDYADLLGLEPGDTVVELGCGPGYTTARLAERVTPGVVVAVDRHLAALRFLREQTAELAESVRPLVGDVGALPLVFTSPTPTLAAFVLHHVREPRRAIESVAAALPGGSVFLVVEYDPDDPGEVGPPPEHRLAPTEVERWLEAAGFDAESPVDLPEEKYAVRSTR